MINDMKIKKECAVCQRAIWEVVGTRLKKTSEYNEVNVRMNNLTTMTVGVCSEHTKPGKLELAMITEKAHQGWLEEVAFGVGEEQWVKEVGLQLEAVGVA